MSTPRSDPGFRACQRHPDRTTGISCQRCAKPICGECMHEAPVGFRCPGCSRGSRAGGRAGSRLARTRSGAPLLGDRPLSAYSAAAILVALKVVVGLANLVSGGAVLGLLAFFAGAVAQGQVWRLVTHSFTSVGLFGLLLNAVFLFFICRMLEAEVGRWRIITSYLISGFGAACVVFLLAPGGVLVGGLVSVLGLLAMNAALKLRRGEDIKAELVFLGILVVFNLALGAVGGGGTVSQLLGILGGVGFGAGTGLVYASGRGQPDRSRRQVAGLSALVAGGAVLVLLRMLAGLFLG